MHPLPVPACTCRPLSVPFLFCGLRNLTAKQALLVLPRHQYRYRFHTNTDTNNHTHTCLPCTCSWFLVHTHTHALHTHHPYLLVPVVGSQLGLTAIGFSITIPVVLLNLQYLSQEALAVMMRDMRLDIMCRRQLFTPFPPQAERTGVSPSPQPHQRKPL